MTKALKTRSCKVWRDVKPIFYVLFYMSLTCFQKGIGEGKRHRFIDGVTIYTYICTIYIVFAKTINLSWWFCAKGFIFHIKSKLIYDVLLGGKYIVF